MDCDALRFEYDWFTNLIPKIHQFLGHMMGQKNLHMLEIGCFEGRSSVWFLIHLVCGEGSSLTCVDPWLPSIEFSKEDMAKAESHFDHNVIIATQQTRGTLYKIKAKSLDAMVAFDADMFDIIYIDGSHRALDVLGDLIMAWRALKPGGTLICDDYDLEESCPGIGIPRLAIDAFLRCCGEHELLHKQHHVILRKHATSTGDALSAEEKSGNDPYILVQAIAFGFGPASHATVIAKALREVIAPDTRLISLGSGVAEEFFEMSGCFDLVVNGESLTDSDLHQLIRNAERIVSVGDFDFVRLCNELDCPASLVDALYWMWDKDPLPIEAAHPYFVIDFPGVRERIVNASAPPVVVPQICDRSTRGQRLRGGKPKPIVLINFGGIATPFGTPIDPILAMMEEILEVINPQRFDLTVCGGMLAMETLRAHLGPQEGQITFGPLPVPEFLTCLQSCDFLLTTPGMSVAHEALAVGVSTLFLLPLNYSQHRQMEIFPDLFRGYAHISWHMLPDGRTLPANLNEEQAVHEAIAIGKNFMQSAEQRLAFRAEVRAFIETEHRGGLRMKQLDILEENLSGAECIVKALLSQSV